MSDVLLRGEGGPLEGKRWEKWSAILTRRELVVYQQLVRLRDENVNEVSWVQLCRAVDMKDGLYMKTLEALEGRELIGLHIDDDL